MQNARIGDVNLWRAHLPLADVLVPRRQLPYHEDRGQKIEIAPHRGVGNAKGAPELGTVPDLSVPVREHRPEAAQSERRNGAPEIWNIPGEEGPDETVSPAAARGRRGGEIGTRKPAAQPQAFEVFDLPQPEPVQFVERDPPGQGLGCLTKKIGRRTSQHEEAGRRPRPVREDAQQREYFGETVNLVQNDETAQRPQLEPRIGQSGKISRVFQIEPRRRSSARGHQLPSKR